MTRQQWDAEADVVVIGFGGAGASAAIEAAQDGASVLVLERYSGGGATALSGGVVYAGGGTTYQDAVGIDDDVDAMYRYLAAETHGVVSDATLRRFCEESVGNLQWLEKQGVPFEASLCPFKTSYPTDDYYLYYSGNELASPYAELATPAPRGHRTKGKMTSGKVLFKHLAASAAALGVDIRRNARVEQLVTEDGRVVGVAGSIVPATSRRGRLFARLVRTNGKLSMYAPPAARPLNAVIRRMERSLARPIRVRARAGVVITAGGFVFNKEMLEEHAPKYVGGLPIGTIADDGSGIRLGVDAGGATGHLGTISAWRFYNPPVSTIRGVLVGPDGTRVCNEQLYGATVGRHIVEEHGGRAWLVFDRRVFEAIKQETPDQTSLFQRVQIKYLLRMGHKRSSTVEGLAEEVGIEPATLAATIEAYNRAAAAGEPDAFGKKPEYVQPLDQGPFYAFDCSLENSRLFPCPIITLGGLVVDEDSGLVKRRDGDVIEGLYAAGRSAVGVCSGGYVSGLSLADCVFSGRRAGRHAAATATASS